MQTGGTEYFHFVEGGRNDIIFGRPIEDVYRHVTEQKKTAEVMGWHFSVVTMPRYSRGYARHVRKTKSRRRTNS